MKDNLDISVLTPGGQLIDISQPVDPVTLGELFDDIPITFGLHSEDIWFQDIVPPVGIYRVCVSNANQIGVADPYTMTVLEDDINMVSVSGVVLGGQQVCEDYSYAQSVPCVDPQ